ncbi:MAG: acyl-CoA dehydrogenase family protein [Micrococcus sp.]|nr:acyl-CoA dehydrogenase family protein [Micrococcus sp.]
MTHAYDPLAVAGVAETDLDFAAADFYAFEELLSDDERTRLREIREWANAELRPLAVKHWAADTFPHEVIETIAAQDIISPVHRQGRSNLYAGLVHAELTRVDTSLATFMGVHDGLFTGTLEALASPEQQEKWLPDVYAMKKIGAFGLTEPLGGSDVAGGTRTTAEKKGDTWVLNGEKRWIGNATFSDWVVIFARDVEDNQVKTFLVDTSLPGYSATKIENKIALRIVQNAHIHLDNVEVADEFHLAHGNSFHDVNKVLRVTRLAVAWQAVGLQLAAYDVARRYVIGRHQFGKPLARFQLVQDKLVRMMGNTVASTGMMVRLSQLADQGQADDARSALAKAFTTERMRETVALGRELLGGNGIVADYEAAKIFADAEAVYSYEGTRDINTLVAGRALTGVSAFV